VDGDPGFNILVRECVARDNNPESGNQLQLTDAQGCVSKPKLFGSFQTTTNPATGSLIAYAYFQVRIYMIESILILSYTVKSLNIYVMEITRHHKKGRGDTNTKI